MISFDDHPTIGDALQRYDLLDRLAKAVMTCTPPRVFGVHGDWGSGKTSFLHQLHVTLDGMPAREQWVNAAVKQFAGTAGVRCAQRNAAYGGNTEALVVWFEAWRYQHEAAPVVALLHEIRGQLGMLAKLKAKALKLTTVAIQSSLLHLEQLAKFVGLQSVAGFAAGGLANTIQQQGERWEREHLAEKLPAESMREQLEHAINGLLGRKKDEPAGQGRRLVILIDDLDRCEPQATFRLLEGIKLYLNIPNCVFVLGMDQRIVEEAIKSSAPGVKDSGDSAAHRAGEYLEKLFQEVYQLPIVPDVPKQIANCIASIDVHQSTKATIKLLLDEYKDCIPANPAQDQGVLRGPPADP
ncbi:MAG: P-loop NTPase fold protein [Tepidisphaeraceae bacterium]